MGGMVPRLIKHHKNIGFHIEGELGDRDDRKKTRKLPKGFRSA